MQLCMLGRMCRVSGLLQARAAPYVRTQPRAAASAPLCEREAAYTVNRTALLGWRAVAAEQALATRDALAADGGPTAAELLVTAYAPDARSARAADCCCCPG